MPTRVWTLTHLGAHATGRLRDKPPQVAEALKLTAEQKDKIKAINEDLAILKNFSMGERRHVEFRASASNALNRHLLPAPNTSLAGNTFGFITSPQGNSPRNIQLGLKLYF